MYVDSGFLTKVWGQSIGERLVFSTVLEQLDIDMQKMNFEPRWYIKIN
jgi:hypothetical protein